MLLTGLTFGYENKGTTSRRRLKHVKSRLSIGYITWLNEGLFDQHTIMIFVRIMSTSAKWTTVFSYKQQINFTNTHNRFTFRCTIMSRNRDSFFSVCVNRRSDSCDSKLIFFLLSFMFDFATWMTEADGGSSDNFSTFRCIKWKYMNAFHGNELCRPLAQHFCH